MEYFYNETIRKYIIVFGSIFSNIHVKRIDPYGLNDIDIRIPIRYANKQKMYIDIKQNADEALRPGEILLPALSWSLDEIRFDNERKKLPNKIICYDAENPKYITVPKPFDFSFTLYIWTKHESDLYKILEQVLYNSIPSTKVTINDMPDVGLTSDISIIYEDNSPDSEIGEDIAADASVRLHKWRISYILKGYLYSNIQDAKLIKIVNTNWRGYDITGKIDEDSLIINQNFQVYPFDSIESDEYKIQLTRTENNNIVIKFYDKP